MIWYTTFYTSFTTGKQLLLLLTVMFLLCLETTFDCNLFSMFYLLGYFLFPWKVSFIIPVLIFPQLSFHVYFQNQFERPLFCPWYQWTNVLEFPRIKIFLSGPAGNYLFKVNNRNTITRCEICSKLTIKTPGRHQRRSGVFIVNFNIFHTLL